MRVEASVSWMRAVIQRDGRYLLVRYNRPKAAGQALWALPGAALTGATAPHEQALRNTLWHDLGVSVRYRGRVGLFHQDASSQVQLVVAAEILGQPDPDPHTVLDVGWYTLDELEALGRNGLLADGFEYAAIARERRKGRRSAPHLGGRRGRRVAVGLSVLLVVGLVTAGLRTGLAVDCGGPAVVFSVRLSAHGQDVSRCIPLGTVRAWPGAVVSLVSRQPSLLQEDMPADESVQSVMRMLDDEHASVLEHIGDDDAVRAALEQRDSARLSYLLWPYQSMSGPTYTIGGGVAYLDVFDRGGGELAYLRQRSWPEEAANRVDQHASAWEPVRRALAAESGVHAGLVLSSWGERVVYWAAPVRKDGRVLGVIAVGEPLGRVVEFISKSSDLTIIAYEASGTPLVGSTPGTEVAAHALAVSSADRSVASEHDSAAMRVLAFGAYRAVEHLGQLQALGQPLLLIGASKPFRAGDLAVSGGVASAPPAQDCADILVQRYVQATEAVGRAAFRCLGPSVRDNRLANLTEDEYVASMGPPPLAGDMVSRAGTQELPGGVKQVQFVLLAQDGRADQIVAVYLDADGHVTRPPSAPTASFPPAARVSAPTTGPGRARSWASLDGLEHVQEPVLARETPV